jgi:hypothetical protein
LPDRLPARGPARPVPARLAGAAVSPSAALATAAGAAVGLVVGGGAPAAVLVFAAAGWVLRLAVAAVTGGRPRAPRIDPFTLREPWRRFVQAALQAQARYDRTVAQAPPGPLRERLGHIGRRIDVGVAECWRVAQRGHALDDALAALDVPGAERRLAALEQEGGGAEEVVESLRARLATAARMREVADEARDRLRVIDARLGEAVARGVELSVRTGAPVDVGALGDDVDDLVLELEALRAALEETDGGAP